MTDELQYALELPPKLVARFTSFHVITVGMCGLPSGFMGVILNKLISTTPDMVGAVGTAIIISMIALFLPYSPVYRLLYQGR